MWFFHFSQLHLRVLLLLLLSAPLLFVVLTVSILISMLWTSHGPVLVLFWFVVWRLLWFSSSQHRKCSHFSRLSQIVNFYETEFCSICTNFSTNRISEYCALLITQLFSSYWTVDKLFICGKGGGLWSVDHVIWVDRKFSDHLLVHDPQHSPYCPPVLPWQMRAPVFWAPITNGVKSVLW